MDPEEERLKLDLYQQFLKAEESGFSGSFEQWVTASLEEDLQLPGSTEYERAKAKVGRPLLLDLDLYTCSRQPPISHSQHGSKHFQWPVAHVLKAGQKAV